MGCACPASRWRRTVPRRSCNMSGCRRASLNSCRPVVHAASWRCVAPPGRCSAAMPRWWPASPATPMGPIAFHDLVAQFSSFSRDCVWPYGAGGPNESFALLTDHAMRRTGATREDFGKLCVAQRQWAQRNPLALLRGELTLQGYLAAPPIALPLHLFDCVMPCAGADGFLVMHRARARIARPTLRAHPRHDRAAQRISGRSDTVARRLGNGCRRAVAAGGDRA